MDFQKASREVLSIAKKNGLKNVDVLIERSEELEVQIRNGKLEKVEQSTNLGLGIRVLKEGRSGFASTEKLDQQSIERTLLKAKSNSDFQDSAEIFMPEPGSAQVHEKELELFNDDLNQLKIEDLGRMGLETEAAAKETDSRLTAIPYLGVSRNISEIMTPSTFFIAFLCMNIF